MSVYVNSQILYSLSRSNNTLTSTKFIETLALNFVRPQLIERLTQLNLRKYIRDFIENIISPEEFPDVRVPKGLYPNNTLEKSSDVVSANQPWTGKKVFLSTM